MSTDLKKVEKTDRRKEINELVQAFCDRHLNEELAGYALKLCDTLGRKRTLAVTRGRKEIWAAAIVYVIARLNFLFDRENEYFLTADTICEFFGSQKTTVGNKATQIEKACRIGMGAEGFCSQHISDTFTLVELPNGLVVPKSMLSDFEIVYEMANEEETEEIEKFLEEQQRIKDRKAREKKARRTEINRKIAEDKRKKKQDQQLGLFDEF
jgi:hypothetical protein